MDVPRMKRRVAVHEAPATRLTGRGAPKIER
jgi:hypothetical protein